MEKIVKTVNGVRNCFNTNKTLSLKWRKEQLNALMRLIDENEKDLCDALQKDLKKNDHETFIMEFGVIKNGIINTLNNLDTWARPEQVTPPFQVKYVYKTFIQPQPYGVSLIIGAWNYPYQVNQSSIKYIFIMKYSI